MGTRSISSPTFTATMTANIRNTVNSDAQTPSVQQGQTLSDTFTSGTTDSKFDRFWESRGRTISGAGSENLDLYDLGSIDIGAGAGLDAVGQSWTVAEIVGIQIAVTSDSVGSLYVGGVNATTAFQSMFHSNGSLDDAAGIVLPPGANFQIWTTNDPGWAVADTSNHLLKMAAVGGDVEYSIAVAARSA